jgi:hypothetical protein
MDAADHIPVAPTTEVSRRIYWRNFALFVVMGCGASWIFPNALAQQIPVFQQTLPGGLCIATYMNAATNFSFVACVGYVVLNRRYGPFPHSVCVPILLTLGGLGAYLASATYTVVFHNVAIMLLICCAMGGAVGGLSSVVMNPFLTRFKNDYIISGRSGTSVGTILTALLAVVQNPGSTSASRFSTSTYLAIFGGILSFPILAYGIIEYFGLGLRDPMPSSANDQFRQVAVNDISEHDCEFVGGSTGIADRHEHRIDMVMSPMATRRSVSPIEETSNSSESIFSVLYKQFSDADVSFELQDSPKPKPIALKLFSRIREKVKDHPWLLRALPYMCSIGWINLNQWGVLSAVAPFAMANVSPHGGALTLSIGFQFGALGLLAGDLSTVYFRVPLRFCVPVFTICALILYACALGWIGYFSPAAPPLLIIVWSISRFFEAHVATSAYRYVATEFPFEHREAAARACGLTDQVCTTVGTIISTTIISSFGNC